MFEYPCPTLFNSSDSYKYQGCYKVIRQNNQGPKAGDEKCQANTSASVQHILWIVPSIVAIGFIVAFAIVCLKMRKKTKASGRNTDDMNVPNTQRGQSKEDEDGDEYPIENTVEGESTGSLETGQSKEDGDGDEYTVENTVERESLIPLKQIVYMLPHQRRKWIYFLEDMPLPPRRLNTSHSTESGKI